MTINMHHPQNVANAFVAQYYMVLNRSPEIAHKFYGESSQLGWAESDGVITPVTTLSAIKEKILSSDYKNGLTAVKTVDAQKSHDGGVFVAVTGSLIENGEVTKNFFQTFYLAEQEKGFFVLNDILRVFDASAPMTNVAVNASTVQSSDAGSIFNSSTSSPTNAADENAKLTQAFEFAVPMDTDAKRSSPTSSIASGEKEPPIVAPASNAAVAPASDADVVPAVAPASDADVLPAAAPASTDGVAPVVAPALKADEPSVVAPASNADVSPVVAPASNVSTKISYASMVAKASLVTSPRSPKTAAKPSAPLPNGGPNASAPLANGAPKPSAPLPNGSPKASTPLGNGTSKPSAPLPNGGPKASAPLGNGTPKAPTPGNYAWKPASSTARNLRKSGNGAPKTNAHADARGIYIGRLPYDITKQGVADVLKKFGHLRRHSDSVQIRRYEDGFCCGFVEFESPDSARLAVEAHRVKFGEKEAYIAYKKSSYGRGGSRSPTRGRFRNGNDARPGHDRGQARGSQRSRSSGQGAR